MCTIRIDVVASSGAVEVQSRHARMTSAARSYGNRNIPA